VLGPSKSIGHLSDLEALHDGRIDDFIAGLPELRPADMTNKATYTANHNEQPLSVLLSGFRNKRAAYINRLESLEDTYFERKALHIRLKQLITVTDALFFTAEHDMQHLSTVARLCSAKGPPEVGIYHESLFLLVILHTRLLAV
jgi:hypothetical protein